MLLLGSIVMSIAAYCGKKFPACWGGGICEGDVRMLGPCDHGTSRCPEASYARFVSAKTLLIKCETLRFRFSIRCPSRSLSILKMPAKGGPVFELPQQHALIFLPNRIFIYALSTAMPKCPQAA